MTPKEKLTIEIIFLATCLIVATIFWAIGFSAGYDVGIIEGQKPQMENCGFFYDPITNTFSRDMTRFKINLTTFQNETA